MLLLGALQLSFAQEKVVTGTKKDNVGHELPRVTAIIKGGQMGTKTDFDGKYSLKVAQGKVLVFSFIGMKNKEITVGNSSKIDVILEE
ncbi:carboxypeptidase-like regulatory domain-containing protein [Capnocytophaga cynodegmi]|uniref:Uncharacterized protein n=1 Tax=Capnocytophaga cynodegmi TaxID=28189 RepID=A0A0B7HD91_9FLAO|nr:carboxypeptidase-like regulatory domain-containing protein [Capnocytophaga cynodegmi]CEN35553.1 hypothetical protein CCYN2B_270002 [Capnocytophaga cynodegmi]